jgi:serine/threonine protein kinase
VGGVEEKREAYHKYVALVSISLFLRMRLHLDGTLRWQAPELLNGATKLTPATDVYAFSICCVEILGMGDLPYGHRDDKLVAHLVLGGSRSIAIHTLITHSQTKTNVPRFPPRASLPSLSLLSKNAGFVTPGNVLPLHRLL